MTRHTITDLDRITETLNLSNPIERMLWEELDQPHAWESVGQIIAQLECASCAAGSWSDMIYTADIESKLADPDWRWAIDEALVDWCDNTGESYEVESVSDLVTFAVDHTAYLLACRLRCLDRVAVVIAASDSMDPHPDVIAFDTVYDAEDWVSDEIERRVQFRVEHSPQAISEDERDQWSEEEKALFTIKAERL